MIFGRRKRRTAVAPKPAAAPPADADESGDDGEYARIGYNEGPHDIDDLAPGTDITSSHLDLGSVLVPVIEGGQVTVEMAEDHQPIAVHLVSPLGRITVQAFAAPKSPGQWRGVVTELAESLREDGADIAIESGHWGREVVARAEGGVHRFVGVDGYRWMIRAVASAPEELGESMAEMVRAVIAETVVRRGDEPHPARAPLPISLPPVLAEQVAAAQQQMYDAPEDGASGPVSAGQVSVERDGDDPLVIQDHDASSVQEQPEPPRSAGSAMQQLRNRDE